MKHTLRLAAAGALLAGLSGCNNVVSMEPWFTAADAEGAPELREGLWVMLPDNRCRVDLEKPAERWPDCANSVYLRGDEWWSMQWEERQGRARGKRVFEGWESRPTILAAGDPAILQVDQNGDLPLSTPEPDESVIGEEEPDWRYSYSAIRPTQLDGLGRVVAFELWGVECGPLPERVAPASDDPDAAFTSDYVTTQPFPGLAIVGSNCTAESADAIRRAAVSSRSIGHPIPIRWIRDGWR